MAQEEKARAYDEAIERAREKSNDEHITSPFLKSLLEDIFPELKESKDEKIKKTLINLVKSNGTAYYINQIHKDDIFAWLENQDKKVDVIENFDTEFEKQVSHLLASVLNKDYEYTEGFIKWVSSNLLGYAKYEIEKQSPRPQSTQKTYATIVDFMNGEPKFKVGDWIVTDLSNVVRVESIVYGRYKLETSEGVSFDHEVSDEYIDKNWHRWSIEDAKDGDVLIATYSGKPFIYNGCFSNLYVGAYYGLSSDDEFSVGDIRYCGKYNVRPATKEQRDLLEKAMTDAGYTFDFKKKEFKEKVTD